MNKQLMKDGLLWGFILWLFGYLLGIVFFAFIPNQFLGWAIMPFGITLTLWVLFKKISKKMFREYVVLGVIWTVIAIICDYFQLVQVFKPQDGYYKLDVYLYYLLTFLLPSLYGYIKK
jgi:hypothetical protein